MSKEKEKAPLLQKQGRFLLCFEAVSAQPLAKPAFISKNVG